MVFCPRGPGRSSTTSFVVILVIGRMHDGETLAFVPSEVALNRTKAPEKPFAIDIIIGASRYACLPQDMRVCVYCNNNLCSDAVWP